MNIAIYPRVSTQEQANEGYSISEQISKLTAFCAVKDWSVYRVYTDAGYSGANMNRPGLQTMIADVESGKIDKVLVYKLDRLSRSQLDTLYLIEKVFLANGCDFVSLSENFDTATPFGRAMIGILAVFAQLEREQIKERMQMGRDARAKEGKWHGSNNYPIGYTYSDGQLVPDPLERIAVEKIYSLAADGVSAPQIAAYLNQNAYAKRYPCTWSDVIVRRVLTSKSYLGYIRAGNEWIKGTHEPIITEEQWNAAQQFVQMRRDHYNSHGYRLGFANSYLAGLLVCGHCGAGYAKVSRRKMLKTGERRRYERYECYSRSKVQAHLIKDPACKNKIWRMHELDQIVFAEVKKLNLEKIRTAPDVRTDHCADLQRQIDTVTVRISKLLTLYETDAIPQDILNDRIRTLNEERTRYEQMLSAERARSIPDNRDQIVHAVQTFADVLERGTMEEIRALLRVLIDRIELDGDNIHIFWRFKVD